MGIKKIKHLLLRLSPEEKLLGAGGLLIIIGSFLPWYSLVLSYGENNINETGFSGDLGVIGFIVFLLTLSAIAYLISDQLRIKIPRFGFKKEQINLFLMGEGAFLLLLAIAIYTKRSLDYTNAEIRFGLYLSLIGALMGTFASFAQIQRNEKSETEAFFGQSADEKPSKKKNEKSIPAKEKSSIEVKSDEKAHQKSFFYEEEVVQEKDEEDFDSSTEEFLSDETEENADDTTELIEMETVEPEEEMDEDEAIPEDDLVEEVEIEMEIEPEETKNAVNPESDEKEIDTDQKNYFMKEAGLSGKAGYKVSLESMNRKESKPEGKENNSSMDFYKDL